ncbi:MAG: hypothetical protein KFF46_08855 [Desulfobacterales bacterium]|nr:hypothetical protein [Desulfobacterales bacterium]
MGALAHFLEAEGIATTQISLIREHTEKIRPPRALWVPFDLGRPLGVPDDPDFQTKVLVSALELLGAQSGPVLADFLEEAPAREDDSDAAQEAWSCPISFSDPEQAETDLEKQVFALGREMTELMPWYDKRRKEQNRTAVANFKPNAAADLLSDYLLDRSPKPDDPEMTLAVAIRLAVQDLKTFYYEAASYQPGAAPPTSQEFTRWFWTQTAAGHLIRSVSEKCKTEADKSLQMTGKAFLVPMGW